MIKVNFFIVLFKFVLFFVYKEKIILFLDLINFEMLKILVCIEFLLLLCIILIIFLLIFMLLWVFLIVMKYELILELGLL